MLVRKIETRRQKYIGALCVSEKMRGRKVSHICSVAGQGPTLGAIHWTSKLDCFRNSLEADDVKGKDVAKEGGR